MLEAIKGSSKPVIYYGGGCQDSKAELRELCYKTGIPVTSTLMVGALKRKRSSWPHNTCVRVVLC